MENSFEYTEEMFKEDKKIAEWTLRNEIKITREFKELWKDDLIQRAIIQIYRGRQLYVPNENTKYVSYAIKIAKRTMWGYIEHEQKRNNNISLNKDINEDSTLLDIIGNEDKYEELEKMYLQALKNTIYKAIMKRKELSVKTMSEQKIYKRKTTKAQIIAIDYYIKGYTQKQLTEKYKYSRQAISKAINKFKVQIAEAIEKSGLL